jgi:exopolysaccharide biosynthesis polyprenyl glycosylphosphotransferase
MKTISQSLIFASICFSLLFCAGFFGKSWASAFPQHQETRQIEDAKISQVPQDILSKESNYAPEPSSLILFGSGILSMLIGFFRRTYNAGKRLMDIVTSVIALIILSPLCLLVAALIKLTSKGPIFYTQIRAGKDWQNFKIYKFRTMKVDAEKTTGPVWAKLKDDRITPIGRFLRKSRIDEIPQFVNVIKGDMSVIGPRPERPVFVNELKVHISDYPKRLSVKPGITGLAQVYHRYDKTITDVRKKVKYDLLYIKKMCFLTDLGIILRTFRVVLTGFGAQ